jgi:hypothetical protein
MSSKGIRIEDEINRVVSVKLPDVLCEIHNGNQFYWSILDLQGTGNLGEGKSIPAFVDQIDHSENGYYITWEDLVALSYKFWQTYDIVIIGCYDKKKLRRYENDQVMYETCDVVIVMFDSSYWEVFSKDPTLISRLGAKFKNIKYLEPDFER